MNHPSRNQPCNYPYLRFGYRKELQMLRRKIARKRNLPRPYDGLNGPLTAFWRDDEMIAGRHAIPFIAWDGLVPIEIKPIFQLSLYIKHRDRLLGSSELPQSGIYRTG